MQIKFQTLFTMADQHSLATTNSFIMFDANDPEMINQGTAMYTGTIISFHGTDGNLYSCSMKELWSANPTIEFHREGPVTVIDKILIG